MKRMIPFCLAYLSIFAGCASTREASEPSDLTGEWRRDDGASYLFVMSGPQVLGRKTHAADFGCRVALELKDTDLRGSAHFSRLSDEGCVHTTAWELRVVGSDRLEGRLEGVDFEDFDKEVGRSWETHSFQRVAGLEAPVAESLLHALESQLEADARLARGDREGALLCLTRAESVSPPEARRIEERRLALGAEPSSPPSPAEEPAATPATERDASPSAEPKPEPVVVAAPETEPQHDTKPAPSASLSWQDGEQLSGIADLQLAEGNGWEGDFHAFTESWTFEKGTPAADGPFNDVSRFYLGTPATGSPVDVASYARRLVEDADFQDMGFTYSEISRQESRAYGWVIEGLVVDSSDAASPPELGLVVRLEVGDFRLLCRGSRFASPALRAEALALCEALVPVLQAHSQERTHSQGHTEEMAAFLALLDGSDEAVSAALKAHAVVGIDSAEMDWYMLSHPQRVAHEGDTFVYDFKSGMMVRSYALSWQDGRIVRIENRGVR